MASSCGASWCAKIRWGIRLRQLLGVTLHVFNAPPGWPTMPPGWIPEPGWRPSPSWSAAPTGWNYWVQPNLKMMPLDLTQEIYLGPVSQLSQSYLVDVGRSAADAVAWRVCALGTPSDKVPLATYLRFIDDTETALQEARRRVYSMLLEDAKAWVGSLRAGSTEWEEACRVIRPFLDSRDGFLDVARSRVRAVLQAAGSESSAAYDQRPRTSQGL